jgi:hypothetical protein
MTLYRSKTCEISGENAILDFNLTAVQMGTDKKIASADEVIRVPAQEVIEVPVTEEGVAATINLKHAPIKKPAFIYALNEDSSLGEKYASDETAPTETKFVVDPRWTSDIAFEPRDKTSIRIRQGKDFMVDSRILKKAQEYTLENIQTGSKSKIVIS